MKYYKKSLWKWILLYMAIGAVAYGLIYYFFFYKKGGYSYVPQNYQTQDSVETADWKTYRNDEYGYELQYPSDWFVDTKTSDNVYITPDLEFSRWGESMQITIDEISDKISLE